MAAYSFGFLLARSSISARRHGGSCIHNNLFSQRRPSLARHICWSPPIPSKNCRFHEAGGKLCNCFVRLHALFLLCVVLIVTAWSVSPLWCSLLVFQTDVNTLCKDLPREFKSFFKHIKRLQFEERPDYEYYRTLFERVMKAQNVQESDPWDWEKKARVRFVR